MKTLTRKLLSVIMLISLVATAAVYSVSCSDNKETASGESSSEVISSISSESSATQSGEISFTLTIVNGDQTKQLNISTDEKTVGDALYKQGLIDGKEDGYVTTVDGVKCDYDADKTYWAFYINGEYASTGLYDTEAKDSENYKLEVTKG